MFLFFKQEVYIYADIYADSTLIMYFSVCMQMYKNYVCSRYMQIPVITISGHWLLVAWIFHYTSEKVSHWN